jgi:Ferritin-like
MWGVGWRTPAKPHPSLKAYKQLPPAQRPAMPSIPGRTAKLKAIYLLQIAAEVEHALMTQYLYSAYSLDEAFEQSQGSENTYRIDRWKRDIRTIARQEMAHFVTVQNLLISLGAEVYVNRENNFSEHPDAYPFPVRFEKFGLRPLARYVATEGPLPGEISNRDERKQLQKILHLAGENAKDKINRVGTLYAALYWLFLKKDDTQGPWKIPGAVKAGLCAAGLDGVHIKDSDFAPPDEYEDFHATREEWEIFEDSLHVDDADPRSRALRAIQWIMLQGEGPSGASCNTTESHFCRFLKMYDELRGNPKLALAARPVPLNPFVPRADRKEPVQREADPITHPESKLWADLFNVRYQMLLLDVLLALSTSRSSNRKLRATLTSWAAGNEMEHLKQIGQLLPTLPRHYRSKVLRAGAPFETVPFPLDNTKRWDQQRVLMRGSEDLVKKLKRKVAPHDHRYSLLERIIRFDQVRKPLVEERSSLATRNYAWKHGANQRTQDQT